MKRAATIGLAMTLITLSASIYSPAMADGLLTDLVKDTLGTAAGVVGGVVGGAAGIATGAVSGAANIVSGTVDATGSVLDATGHVVGRVVVDPVANAVAPGWTVVTPGSPLATMIPGSTTTTTRIYTFGGAPTVFGATLDTRIADLRNAINIAESNGRLSSSQAADLRARLDGINSSYIAARGGNTLTFPGALTVARDLDTFNTSLGTTLSVTPFTPLVVSQNGTERILVSSAVLPGATPGGIVGSTINGTGGIIGSTVNGVGGIVGGVLNGVGRVVGGVLGGTGAIASNAVTSTGEVLDTAGNVVGSIVPGSYEMAIPTETSSRMIFGTTTNVLSTNIDLRIADMRRLIARDQFSGRITPAQAAELTSHLDRISSTLATQRVAGRTLTFDEAIALAKELDAANVHFGTFIGSNPFSPMVVMQQGSPRMMIITKNGIVSSNDMPAYSTAAPATTVVTTNGITTNVVGVLPIIDQRRLEFDRLIANGVANHTLNVSEAARLSTDLNTIGLKIAAAQAAGATYGMDQTITLARSLDDFNNRLATSINASPLVPLTITSSNGLPVLSTNVFNNVVGLPAVEPSLWFSTLGGRRAELETMIATGVASRSLTDNQAVELRNELNRINTALETARTGGAISYTTALPLAMSLDVLGNRIHTYAPSTTFVPLISGSRISFLGGLTSPIDELSLRRAELGAEIDRERVLGRLTVQEASRLQYQLGAIADREGSFRKDGLFTYRELSIINTELSRFAAKLNTMIANRRATVSVR
jgi:hypothetical protein